MNFSEHPGNLSARERWNAIHAENKREDIVYDAWLEDFDELLESCATPVINLGCGGGNNVKYLVERGISLIACDYSSAAISNIRKNFPEVQAAECFDMTEGLPFPDSFTDIIIADLSLHYFPERVTESLLRELKRVLAPGGILLARLNSVKDINHGAQEGEELERHLRRSEDGRLKRFFDLEDIERFFADWDIVSAREGELRRYALPKMLWTLLLRSDK